MLRSRHRPSDDVIPSVPCGRFEWQTLLEHRSNQGRSHRNLFWGYKFLLHNTTILTSSAAISAQNSFQGLILGYIYTDISPLLRPWRQRSLFCTGKGRSICVYLPRILYVSTGAGARRGAAPLPSCQFSSGMAGWAWKGRRNKKFTSVCRWDNLSQ